ncbi:hypothetical protein ACFSTC_58345 [Nonomuraea ferruginea]
MMGTTTIDGEALETAPRRRRGRRAAWLTTATVLVGAVAAAGLGLLDRAPAGRPAAALPLRPPRRSPRRPCGTHGRPTASWASARPPR